MRDFARFKRSLLVDEYASAGLPSPIEAKLRLQREVNLRVGNMIDLSIMTDQTPPLEVRQVAAEAAMRGGYVKNLLSVRQKISELYATRFGVDLNPESMFLVAGGQTALDNAFKLLIESGDEVVLFEPEYATYEAMVRFYGGVPQAQPLKLSGERWSLDLAELREKVTPKTKLIVFSSPNNPSGYVFTREDLTEIARLADENDCWVISDETWAMILLDESAKFVSTAEFTRIRDRLVIIYSASKTFGMSGYRMGAAIGPSDFMAAFDQATRFSCHAAPTVGQYALEKALDLEITGGWIESRVAQLRERARETMPRIAAAKHLRCAYPQSGVFLFPDISCTGLSSMDFAVELLRDKGVYVFPGFFYGRHSDRHVRISMAVPDQDFEKGMDRLLAFVAERCT